MIKRMLVVLAMAAPVLAQAEVSAGTFEVTGSGQLGYLSTTVDPDGGTTFESSTFGLDVGGLYYLTPMVGLGAEVFADYTTNKQGGLETNIKRFGLAPKVGLDLHVADKVSLFGDLKIGWREADSDNGSKTSGMVWGVGAGLKYFLAPSFSASIGLNYEQIELDSNQDGKATFSNLFFGLGFSGYFGGK